MISSINNAHRDDENSQNPTKSIIRLLFITCTADAIRE